MKDYKASKYTRSAVKCNRLREEKKPKPPRPPRDWGATFARLKRGALLFGRGLAVVTAVAALVIGVRVAVFESSTFRVATVRVESSGRIAADVIRAQSNIRPGQSMFDIDLELVGRKIAENPWIATARVERRFPREVVIHVSEHLPAAVINLGCLYYVDESGVVFKPLEAGDKVDYPLLTGIERQTLIDQPEETQRLLAGAIELLKVVAARPAFHLGKVSEVHIDANGGYDLLTLNGGVPIRVGFDNYAAKLARLERVLPELEARMPIVRYVDLNVVDRVIVKLDTSLVTGKDKNNGATKG